MPLKRRHVSMWKDDVAWERNDAEIEAWEKSLHKSDLYRAIGALILKYKPGEAVELHVPIRGGYNVFFRLEYKDGTSAAMRIPIQGGVRFPDEKVRYEVATMRYVAANTTIPVPAVYHHGTAEENPTGLGPFIIMEYVEHERTMSDALKDPALEPGESHSLDPDIGEQKLVRLYGQMANILLQLSALTFPRIGSLVQDADGRFSVSGRPLIQNMNYLAEFTAMPAALLPPPRGEQQHYSTADEWYAALADMHFAQLVFQRNDAVHDEDDARDKYVARQLFRRLAAEGQLARGWTVGCGKDDDEPAFRLFSEDLRPSNVLIDEDLRVVGVIDWEFAYAAPAQFSFDPPWWLLLMGPGDWPGAYAPWMEAYKPRLDTFLRVLEAEEKKVEGEKSARTSPAPLSQRMRERWEDRSWMISYAARNSWAFDLIFWRHLDPKFFGPNEDGDHRARLGLLSQRERDAMERLVSLKMVQQRERTLVPLGYDSAAAQLSEFMV